MSLKAVFEARSVAVVGASATPGKIGYTIVENLLGAGFQGRIHPVNPRGGEILGLTAVRDPSEIPGKLDLAVMCIPAPLVPAALEQVARAGAQGAVVISGGFGEVGNAELEEVTVSTARRLGIRLIGPNCQGVNYTPRGLCATWPLLKVPGPIAIISQSGTVGAALGDWAEQEGLGISAFVGLGNKADVSELELMEYFAGDPHTRCIALYLERVRDGHEFRRVAKEVRAEKPVAILRGGRTARGRVAAESHTRSVAGSYAVFKAVAGELGLYLATTVTGLYDLAKFAALSRPPAGRRIFCITSSGGSGILAVDAAEELGLVQAELLPDLAEELRATLPERCVISNPLDLTGDADAARYLTAGRLVAAHQAADVYLMIFGDPVPGASQAARALQELVAPAGGTVVACCLGGGEVERDEVVRLHQAGIPAFPAPERAVAAVAATLDRAPQDGGE
ncbi:MAG: CoA-binding protein [Bacillota bacterium]